MAAERYATPTLTVAATSGRRAGLILVGEVRAEVLRQLEEQLDAPPLSRADEWVVDMNKVTGIDLACVYALLQAAATRRPKTVTLTVRGARHAVRRTLHAAGLDVVAAIER
ncbi:STAS domain-containing protein [Streptomyces carpinensis]|uniref:STAS domain-containing protein n=1 Tax=Streptomyces carpinensis TaxID=66369 RepID=A0ABV1VUI8_9ACTN|nr:STAS domain-containing protein [Streptomyces carpinensis]